MGRKRKSRSLVLANREDGGPRVTTKMQVIAAYDAQGVEPKVIAELAETSVGYIYSLRSKEVYKALVSDIAVERSKAFTNAIETLKKNATDAARDLIGVLQEMVEAEDEEGRPIYSVRLAAAKILADNPAVRAALGSVAETDDGSTKVVAGEIHVHFGEQHLHEAADGATVIEHPDIDPD